MAKVVVLGWLGEFYHIDPDWLRVTIGVTVLPLKELRFACKGCRFGFQGDIMRNSIYNALKKKGLKVRVSRWN
jgi:hypothetical protein